MSKQESIKLKTRSVNSTISWKWQHGPLTWIHKRGRIRCSQNGWSFPAQYVAPINCQSQNRQSVSTNLEPTLQTKVSDDMWCWHVVFIYKFVMSSIELLECVLEFIGSIATPQQLWGKITRQALEYLISCTMKTP